MNKHLSDAQIGKEHYITEAAEWEIVWVRMEAGRLVSFSQKGMRLLQLASKGRPPRTAQYLPPSFISDSMATLQKFQEQVRANYKINLMPGLSPEPLS